MYRTRDKNHKYLLNTEECSSICRGTSWEQNADTPALLPNYSLTLIEVQNGEAPNIGTPPEYLYPLPKLGLL